MSFRYTRPDTFPRVINEKYAVARLQPVDMLPHTHHIENVVRLKLRE